MTDTSDVTNYRRGNGLIRSDVEPQELSGEGKLFFSIDKGSPFGHGLLYVDKYGNENFILMTREAYHKMIGEMVRWML
jgi:hypothetical protein